MFAIRSDVRRKKEEGVTQWYGYLIPLTNKKNKLKYGYIEITKHTSL